MSFGKLANSFIDIIEQRKIKDSSGFIINHDEIIASIRAYKEFRHGNLQWANLTTFSKASVLFRFRKIQGIEVTTAHVIVCDTGRYKILSVENIKNKNFYIEVLCEEVHMNG